ncbi:MAG TPA: FtsX-like permease family protein [Bacteroidia bacterium]|nr:FtsX-like permease family protein [Bacteroidia bacterium]
MNVPFFIAKRYLISKKSHNAINIISGISVGGICIGTMALVIVLSGFNGLSKLVESLYNSFDPDIEITVKKGKTFEVGRPELQALKEFPGVVHFTEVMEGNALLKYNDKQSIAIIKGVSQEFQQMNGFDSLVRDGYFDISKNNIVVGKGLAYMLDITSNNTFTPISIYAPKRGTNNSLNPEDGLNELKCYASGLFSISDEFDNQYVIMDIARARQLLDYKDEVTSIELGLKKGSNPEQVQADIIKLLGSGYVVKNRQQQNALLYKTLKSEKLWVFIILVFILVVATFNVIGSLTMLIIEKKKDISILNSMGADMLLIRRIFLVEGLLITIIGAASGLLLGLLICWIQIHFSIVKFSEGYVVDAYPMDIQSSDVLIISCIVLLIGLFAAWYPVRVFTKKQLALH